MKIFVSSTYIDLVEYRRAVEKAINLLGQQFKGMEYFGSRSEEPKIVAFNEIDQCDIFVGVYAHRYGFIPDGDTKSITEQEFDYARKQSKKIHSYRVSSKQPWLPEYIEGDPGKTKLTDFIKRIEKDFVRQEFTTPEDLLAKVSPDLSREMAAEGKPVITTHPLPPIPYFVHPYPLQEHFTGRATEQDMLTSWLTKEPAPLFSLIAMGGMGKSALSWVWTNQVFSLGIPIEGVFWWSFYDSEGRDFNKFLQKAIAYVSNGAITPEQINSPRDGIEILVNILSQKRFLFVLDGFERVLRSYARMDAAYRGDEFDKDEKGDFRSCTDPNVSMFLRHTVSGTLSKILITSRLFPRKLDDLAGAKKHELTGMDPADAVEFFKKQGIKGNHTEIEAVCSMYGYHPLTLRLLAGALAHDPRCQHDIKHAPKVDPLDDMKEQKILKFAYDCLPDEEKQLISRLAAFRNPMKWDTIRDIFIQSGRDGAPRRLYVDELHLSRSIQNLIDRGIYQRDHQTDTYDLHPIVRRYCYDQLTNKQQTHEVFIDYFSKIEQPQKVETLDDLQPVIELYHHTVKAGKYDEACDLFYQRINQTTYYQLGAYQLRIELLRELFPDGEDKLPCLKVEGDQEWTLSALANSYSLSGQMYRAVPLYEQHNAICEKQNDKRNFAVGLGAMANVAQLPIGKLASAEQNFRRSIDICREIKDEFQEAVGHQEFGKMFAYFGKFEESENELISSTAYWKKNKDYQGLCLDESYRSLSALHKDNFSEALNAAQRALEFAEATARIEYPFERDFIHAYWLIGASHCGLGNLTEAEKHLQEALSRDRRINLVELEAPILLEFAKLRLAQSKKENNEHKKKNLVEESLKHATEALEIADRCEHRLQQAEIHNFLAEWYFESATVSTSGMVGLNAGERRGRGAEENDKSEYLKKAKEHAEKAKESAYCDGPPHYYKVAYEKAEAMLAKL